MSDVPQVPIPRARPLKQKKSLSPSVKRYNKVRNEFVALVKEERKSAHRVQDLAQSYIAKIEVPDAQLLKAIVSLQALKRLIKLKARRIDFLKTADRALLTRTIKKYNALKDRAKQVLREVSEAHRSWTILTPIKHAALEDAIAAIGSEYRDIQHTIHRLRQTAEEGYYEGPASVTVQPLPVLPPLEKPNFFFQPKEI
jgi:hypothetical protein